MLDGLGGCGLWLQAKRKPPPVVRTLKAAREITLWVFYKRKAGLSMKILKAPLRDAQTESPVLNCQKCGGEVYHGETVFCLNGKTVCVDCFKESVTDWLDLSPNAVADALGFEYERVG